MNAKQSTKRSRLDPMFGKVVRFLGTDPTYVTEFWQPNLQFRVEFIMPDGTLGCIFDRQSAPISTRGYENRCSNVRSQLVIVPDNEVDENKLINFQKQAQKLPDVQSENKIPKRKSYYKPVVQECVRFNGSMYYLHLEINRMISEGHIIDSVSSVGAVNSYVESIIVSHKKKQKQK